MRAVFVILAAGAIAAPGAALAALVQPSAVVGLTQARDAEFAAQATSARARDVAVTNERSAQDARLATDQALRDIAAAQARPTPPVVLANPRSPSPPFDASAFVSIPDDKLAASNAAVRAAAGNRR